MEVYLTWTALKALITDKGLLRYVEKDEFYSLKYKDFESSILKSDTTDCTDFETNYKSAANKSPSQTVTVDKLTPFGSKTITIGNVEKKLYARSTGIQVALTAGANQFDYTLTYPHCKLIGIEAINAEALDYTDLKIVDRHTSPYLGVPDAVLNQFAFSNNLGPSFYIRLAQFDADLYQDMIIRFNYTSVSAKTIGINFILYEVKS